jgi:hypothetical protein
MKIHVDYVHPKLSTQSKIQLVEKETMGDENHVQRQGKKKIRTSNCVIAIYVGSTNFYKKTNEAQKMFIEDLVLYICNSY